MFKTILKNGLKTKSAFNAVNLIQPSRQLKTSLYLLGVKGTEIKMPVLSPTMTEGTIVKWHKKEGDVIQPGDMICEVQTDKAVVAMELEEEGILAKILINEDAKNIQIGEIIALMVEEGEDWKNVDLPVKIDSKKETVEISQKPKETINFEETHLISPSVRNLVDQYNLDLSKIKPSGPKNIHLKSDVLSYIQSNNIQQSKNKSEDEAKTVTQQKSKAQSFKNENKYIDIEISSMRRTIAKRLTESKTTIPHAYMSVSCDVNESIKYQQELKRNKIPVSFNDLIIKAVALALKKVPEVNSIFNTNTQDIELLRNVDISIAVATDNGLITPIIKNANRLTISEINQTVKNLASKARDGKLQPNEFIGGSFSISNLGMFGITEFQAVINPPQTAILAVGSPRVFVKDFENNIKKLTCSLSYDARVLNEELVATFLETFKKNLEEPVLLESSGDGSEHRRLSYYA